MHVEVAFAPIFTQAAACSFSSDADVDQKCEDIRSIQGYLPCGHGPQVILEPRIHLRESDGSFIELFGLLRRKHSCEFRCIEKNRCKYRTAARPRRNSAASPPRVPSKA